MSCPEAGDSLPGGHCPWAAPVARRCLPLTELDSSFRVSLPSSRSGIGSAPPASTLVSRPDPRPSPRELPSLDSDWSTPLMDLISPAESRWTLARAAFTPMMTPARRPTSTPSCQRHQAPRDHLPDYRPKATAHTRSLESWLPTCPKTGRPSRLPTPCSPTPPVLQEVTCGCELLS